MIKHENVVKFIDMLSINDIQKFDDRKNMFSIIANHCVFHFYNNHRNENVDDCKFKKWSICENCFDNVHNVVVDVVVDEHLFSSINRTFSKFENIEIKNIYFDVEKFEMKIWIEKNNNKNQIEIIVFQKQYCKKKSKIDKMLYYQ